MNLCLDFSLLFHGIYPYKGRFSIMIHIFFSSSAITCHITSGEAIPQSLYSLLMFVGFRHTTTILQISLIVTSTFLIWADDIQVELVYSTAE